MAFSFSGQRIIPQQIPSLEAAVKNAQKHGNEESDSKVRNMGDFESCRVESEAIELAGWVESKGDELAELCKKYKNLQNKIKEVF